MKKLISIVIPAYNEESVLGELKTRLQDMMKTCPDYDFEVIIVENGSVDATFSKLVAIHHEDPRFKIVQLSRNFGCDGGITAGLSYARGDAAVIMNADLQDPPELIPRFIREWENGYEIIYGVIQKREGVGVMRRVLSRLAYMIIFKLSNHMIPENASDFRLVDRKVYTIINSMKEKNIFLRGLVVWTGFKQLGIPFERQPRFAGESKADFRTVWNTAMNGIFSFSYFPLKIATVMGFVFSTLTFIMALVEIYLYLAFGREVPGFTTLMLVILFCFGMIFLMFGIMGTYIERIYDEVKQRPNYIVNSEIGFGQAPRQ
ncbi:MULTISPECIES: glycosyltransferase family 2 protein [unclassified Methanoregula]|uniref:glycosyltransferase family 2 protein n=1 Tax=unclassified Methanoregula TaxID=2649730 RepID=UPI0009C91685|nr:MULTISPECIES: glycosyltransferase family 2 protein [unclassified Methanoregula]OPX64341.1 MAG: Glycosyltransferase AglD [Methanoregula sp. PtaB.Bin085]OPY33534.1 MAG: Glycosyltransferase AglD [Methanoregula sp. PtaU1.Bin006]